jgi:hypothetical protein
MCREGRIAIGALLAFAIWLFVGLPLIYAPTSEAQSRSQAKETSGHELTNQSTSVELTRGTLASKPLYTEVTCDEHDGGSECNKGWWLKFWTDPVATFTGMLFIATFFQAIVTWQALVESRRANVAARDAEQNTQTALIITNRPYVFVRDFVPIPVGDPNRPFGWHCVVVWENSGATPTQNLKMWVSWARFTAPVPDDYPFPDRGERQGESITIIPPRGSVSTTVFTLDIEHALSLMQQRTFTYIWGWAEYEDIFPNTPRRRTEFCVQVLASQIGDDPPRMMVEFRHHRTHNSAT